MNRLACRIVRLACTLLPPQMRRWGQAAASEAEAIGHPGAALAFALGCLFWAMGAAIQFRFSTPYSQGEEPMALADQLRGSRGTALFCALAATGLGLAYMAAGNAPARYLMINVGALAFGLVALGILGMADARRHLAPGPMNVLLGLTLLTVSLFGVTAGGVTRWVALGPLIIQPSVMIVPLMAVLFARSRDRLSAVGITLAALGLALQPDRGMAGALAAGMLVLAFARPGVGTLAAAAIATVGFGATMAQPDPSPAMPFVDQILYSSFSIHPLAGFAVLAGSALLVLPALAVRQGDAAERSACAVFGAVWAAIVVAAALGNYPTPLVGYGGSAIIGYLLCLFVFPARGAEARRHPGESATERNDDGPALYACAP